MLDEVRAAVALACVALAPRWPYDATMLPVCLSTINARSETITKAPRWREPFNVPFLGASSGVFALPLPLLLYVK